MVSIYIYKYAICSRSVGPFGPPKQENEVQHFFLFFFFFFFFFFFLCIQYFSGCTEVSFPTTNQQQIHAASDIPFDSYQCSLWGVKTRPQFPPFRPLRLPPLFPAPSHLFAVQEGYSPNDTDQLGNTATHLAAANGHEVRPQQRALPPRPKLVRKKRGKKKQSKRVTYQVLIYTVT